MPCKDKKLKVFCGTPSYMAPEIVRRTEYPGKPVDVWSLGVVLYAMISGCFPFSAKSYPELYKKILRGQFRFPEGLFSPVVQQLLTGMLHMDHTARLTIAQVKSHPWLRGHLPRDLKAVAEVTVSPDPKDDIHKEAVARLESLGVPKEVLTRDILERRRNGLTTCYYLVVHAMKLR